MEYLKAFIAGFVATLTFHQGALAVLHAAGLSTKAPYAMAVTAPLQVPAVISLAFWGGVWGILLWLAIRDLTSPNGLMLAMTLGAIGPTFVALFIVFPLKGMPLAGGWDPKIIIGAMILNGAWGLGTALFIRLMARL